MREPFFLLMQCYPLKVVLAPNMRSHREEVTQFTFLVSVLDNTNQCR